MGGTITSYSEWMEQLPATVNGSNKQLRATVNGSNKQLPAKVNGWNNYQLQ